MNWKLDRMDNVPVFYLPLVYMVWSVLIVLAVTIHFIVSRTCKVVYINQHVRDSLPTYIGCGWHEDVMPYFGSLKKFERKTTLMLNNAWFMKAEVLVVTLLGVNKIVWGTIGNSGKKAMYDIVNDLKQGFSTIIAVDGNGPAKKFRFGVLHLAKFSGIPIVAAKVETSAAIRVPFTWDNKRVPLPFSTITIHCFDPIYVTDENFAEATIKLKQNLGLDVDTTKKLDSQVA